MNSPCVRPSVPTPGRFDYVKYDDKAAIAQAEFKGEMLKIEAMIGGLGQSRAASLALTALEETYMWIGKAIRDGQIARQGDATDQPKRGE